MAKSLYVGNIEWNTTDDELYDLFAPFGEIRSAQVIKDHVSGRSKGFGFVEMDDEESADSATANLHGTELRGRTLKVNAARERKSRSYN